jgi:ZIP family zinc transporter
MDTSLGNIGFALLLSVLAGLSTCIGGTIAYFIKKPKLVYLSLVLGFSAGVMIYISFMELLPRAIKNAGEIECLAIFFIGIIFIGLIDMSIPRIKNPHHYKDLSDYGDFKEDRTNKIIMKTGMLTALAIGIHNFPEGLTTLGATLADMNLGIFIAKQQQFIIYLRESLFLYLFYMQQKIRKKLPSIHFFLVLLNL